MYNDTREIVNMKLTRKQEKRFNKELMCLCEEGGQPDHTTSNPEAIKNHLAKELALQKKELLKELSLCNDCFKRNGGEL